MRANIHTLLSPRPPPAFLPTNVAETKEAFAAGARTKGKGGKDKKLFSVAQWDEGRIIDYEERTDEYTVSFFSNDDGGEERHL
jgi:hypothetical protein